MPQLFYNLHNGKLLMVLAKTVHDIILTGEETEPEIVLQKRLMIYLRLVLLYLDLEICGFLGLHIFQHDDF